MKKSICIAILLIFGLILAGCVQKSTDIESAKIDVPLTGETKEFNIEAFQFSFEPSVVEVNLGDKVKITATSRDVPHGLTIDEFGVNLYLDGLRSKTAEFIADKRGEFKFYCSVPCGKGHSSMRGKFIVR